MGVIKEREEIYRVFASLKGTKTFILDAENMIDLNLVSTLKEGIRKYFQFKFGGVTGRQGQIYCREFSGEGLWVRQEVCLTNKQRDNSKSGSGVKHCGCTTGCSSGRCSCFKAEAKCSAHCHNGIVCQNK